MRIQKNSNKLEANDGHIKNIARFYAKRVVPRKIAIFLRTEKYLEHRLLFNTDWSSFDLRFRSYFC